MNTNENNIKVVKLEKPDQVGIGKRIRTARQHLNLKQKDLVKTLGVSAVTMSDIETGKKKPGFDILFSLSTLYSVNLEYILHGNGDVFKGPGRPGSFEQCCEIFGPYADDIIEVLEYMKKSRMTMNAIIALAKEYIYKNEQIIRKDMTKTAEEK